MTKQKYFLSLQWHITTNCSNRCKHCYMYDATTYDDERKNTLSLKNLIKILDDLENFEHKYNTQIEHLSITGGDPLMRSDCFEFLEELKKRKKKFSLMGNPETLTQANVKRLKNLDISHFQMSLDGLELTHDYFRSKGSFQRTLEKLKLLKKYDIRSNIMFSLFPNNAKELLPLMNFVAKQTEATSFSFDIGCFVGCGTNLNKNFTAQAVHQILSDYLKEKEKLTQESRCIFHEKSNLLKLIRFENNKLTPIITKNTPVISGCLIGWIPPSILSDGTLLACRRFIQKVGKLPEQTFEEIFLQNTYLKKCRRKKYFEECKDCELYSVCRGCPANVYSLTGNAFSKQPMCFRKNIKRNIKIPKFNNEPDLNTSNEEEWAFISKYYAFKTNYQSFLKNKDFAYLYLDLSRDQILKNEFLKNPLAYCTKNQYQISQDELAFLNYRFSEAIIHTYNPNSDKIAKEATEILIKDLIST